SAVTETPSSSSGTCAETRVVGSATRTVRSSPSPSGRSAAPQCSGERSTGTSPEGALTAPGTTSRAPSTTSTITSSLATQPASTPPPLSRSRNCPSGSGASSQVPSVSRAVTAEGAGPSPGSSTRSRTTIGGTGAPSTPSSPSNPGAGAPQFSGWAGTSAPGEL